jgi:hypothetical protein
VHGRVERVQGWERFRELLRTLCPTELYYAQGHAPLSRPPIELRLTFVAEGVQYVFIDTGRGDVLRRTGIPVRVDRYGNPTLEEEDIEKFVRSQVKRTDLRIRSFELMGGY